jgi:ApbE superfamily uncharacterized protein (UPF0280 family)
LVIQITYSRVDTAIYKVDEKAAYRSHEQKSNHDRAKLTRLILKTPVFQKFFFKFGILIFVECIAAIFM